MHKKTTTKGVTNSLMGRGITRTRYAGARPTRRGGMW